MSWRILYIIKYFLKEKDLVHDFKVFENINRWQINIYVLSCCKIRASLDKSANCWMEANCVCVCVCVRACVCVCARVCACVRCVRVWGNNRTFLEAHKYHGRRTCWLLNITSIKQKMIKRENKRRGEITGGGRGLEWISKFHGFWFIYQLSSSFFWSQCAAKNRHFM